MPDLTIKALDAAIGQLKLFIQQKLNHRVLYHYTTLSTFGEFIKDDAQLYCTHYATLNDSSEIKYGFERICEHLESENRLHPEVCLQLKAQFVKEYSQRKIRPTWIMSFSLERDSLYQWGLYTNRGHGGYAIGFDLDKLRKIVDNFNCEKCHPHLILRLLPCFYAGKDKESIKTFLNTSFHREDQDMIQLTDRISKDSLAFKNILERMALVACVIKHNSFAYENEVRLIAIPAHNHYENISLVGGKPRWNTQLFPYENKQLRSFIKEVLISPHGDKELLKTTAEMMKCRYGLKYKTKLSESPYNGR